MSANVALQNDVFRLYVLIVSVLLLTAGTFLTVLTWGLKKNIRSLWLTYQGWLIMAPAVLGCIFLGREATIIGYTLVSIAGLKEYAHATGLYRNWWMTGSVYVAIVALCAATLLSYPFNGPLGSFRLFMTMPVFAIAGIVTIPILRNRAQGQLQLISLAIVGFIYIGWMFGHMGLLANSTHAYGYLLYVTFAVQLNDIAAFIFGNLFGKHKLCNKISPNKTWEGALGALAISLALPWALRFSFPHFGPTQLVLTGLIVGIGGQLGDLWVSTIKRDLGLKDMGEAIRGHGGVLDRIDSLIYVAPLFLHMANYSYGLQ